MLDRGQRYGDGFFDTMLLKEGNPVWALAHWDRMVSAAKTLDLAWPFHGKSPKFTLTDLYNEWLQELQNNWIKADRPSMAKVRTVVWRAGGGDFTPDTERFECRISVHPLELKIQNSFRLGPSTVVQCPPLIPWIKSLSAMPYVLAANFAKKQGWDDALLVNARGYFIESSRSNLFYWVDGICYTPSLAEGCLPGITAQYLIKFLSNNGNVVQYSAATYQTLREASAIWLTNSIRGITQVRYWDDDALGHDPYSDLAAAANEGIQGGSEFP